MREIKFRAWDKVCREMFYNSELANGDMMVICLDGEIQLSDDDTYKPDDFILMQYTGRKDINDKEIFEGDIVSFDDCTSTESGYCERGCIGVVEWCNETASFEVSNRLSAESYEVLDECVIIGNIYENPELLK